MIKIQKDKIVVANIRKRELKSQVSKNVNIFFNDKQEELGYFTGYIDDLIEKDAILLKLDDDSYVNLSLLRGILFKLKIIKIYKGLNKDLLISDKPTSKNKIYVEKETQKFYYPEEELSELINISELNKILINKNT